MKNNNHVLKQIVKRSLEHNKLRSRFIILAIAITAMLFSMVFTLTDGVIKSMSWQEMRQAGDTYDGGYKEITKAQYDRLKKMLGLKTIVTVLWLLLSIMKNWTNAR